MASREGPAEAPASPAAASQAAASTASVAAEQAGSGTRERWISESEGSAGPKATERQTLTPQRMLEMRAYRNARYHEDREAHFRALNRWANFAIIVLGSGALATAPLKAEWHPAAISGALTAIVGALQLVFDLGGQAAMHRELRQGFLRILAKSQNEAADIDTLNEEMVTAYAGEPEVFHAVNSMAYNAAQSAYERGKDTLVVVPPWRASLRHWFKFDPKDFPDVRPT